MADEYDALLEILGRGGGGGGGGGGGPALFEGEVLAAGGGKLRVFADGYPLEKKDLRVNPLYRWDWTTAEDVGQPELLRKGETVLLGSTDRQTYYLICKGVSP